MKIKDLINKFEEFQTLLKEHGKLWGASLDTSIPDYPIRYRNDLEKQAKNLGRLL